MKAFEAVELTRINQKELPHGCTLLLKRDKYAAVSNEIPPQREVDVAIQPRVLRQIVAEFDVRYAPDNAAGWGICDMCR
ncbi:hypothetical protein [Bradyrhizobium betae]|uniref:hypothetical protein n=1 Tax=Bradyrhizobium betae TaxID=244734 RepID=UPI0013E97C72|nr:hypothetical protein [Bradyrhizobium betae]